MPHGTCAGTNVLHNGLGNHLSREARLSCIPVTNLATSKDFLAGSLALSPAGELVISRKVDAWSSKSRPEEKSFPGHALRIGYSWKTKFTHHQNERNKDEIHVIIVLLLLFG